MKLQSNRSTDDAAFNNNSSQPYSVSGKDSVVIDGEGPARAPIKTLQSELLNVDEEDDDGGDIDDGFDHDDDDDDEEEREEDELKSVCAAQEVTSM